MDPLEVLAWIGVATVGAVGAFVVLVFALGFVNLVRGKGISKRGDQG